MRPFVFSRLLQLINSFVKIVLAIAAYFSGLKKNMSLKRKCRFPKSFIAPRTKSLKTLKTGLQGPKLKKSDIHGSEIFCLGLRFCKTKGVFLWDDPDLDQ